MPRNPPNTDADLVERVLFYETELCAGSAGRLAADACALYRSRVRTPERGIADADSILIVTMGAASVEPWLEIVLAAGTASKKPRLHVDLRPTVPAGHISDPIEDEAATRSIRAELRSARMLLGRRLRLFVTGSRQALAPGLVPRLRAILVRVLGGEPNPRRLRAQRLASRLAGPHIDPSRGRDPNSDPNA